MGANARNQTANRQWKHDLAIREGSWNKEQSVYRSKMVDYENEYDENYAAAGRAQVSEQTRMNELFEQTAFQKQDMLTQLIQSQGQLGASEKSGNTAGRMNIAMLSAFGRNNAIIAANLSSARNAMYQRNEDTRLKLMGANNRAWSQVASGPTATVAPLPPQMEQPDYLGLALGVAGAVGGGLLKGVGGKAPNGFSGIDPKSPINFNSNPIPKANPWGSFNPGYTGTGSLSMPNINYGSNSFPSADIWTNGKNLNSRNYIR